MFNCEKQGIALCAKWVIRALEGDEAWKILVRHCISTGTPLGKRVWKGMNFHTILIAPVQFKISGSFVVKSIWKAWEALKPWLTWKGCDKKAGASCSSLNLWWSPIIMDNGLLPAQIQWIRALRFHRKGIDSFLDLYDPQTRSWFSWDKFRELYNLKADDKYTFEYLIDRTPLSIWTKLGKKFQKPWWSDWVWPKKIQMNKYKSHMGYFLLSPHVPMADTLNVRWDLFSVQSCWKLRFKVVWSSFLEPKQSFLGWSLLHQGLPIGIRR